MSATYPADRWAHQLWLRIDGSAATVLTAFDGRLDKVEHLKYDVTSAAH